MSGGIHADQITAALKERLQATHVTATDTSDGCGQSFDVVVVSPLFEGKNVLQRHRAVNDALKTEIASIHAFSQKCYSPQQWEDLQKKN